jgi:thiol-disulfide isomerase/thioredoxin
MKAALYVAVAVVAGAAGFFIYKSTLEPASSPAAAASDVIHASAPEQKASAGDETGMSNSLELLPDFTLTDLEGNTRSIRSWPGQSMIVNFWATWCAPCRREIPLLRDIQKAKGADGFQVVGVAIDVREDVLAYAKEIGIDYPVLQGEQEAMEALGKLDTGFGLPITVFTDNQHRIVLTHMGELHKAEADFILEVIGRVNRGELTPAAARTMAAAQLRNLDGSGA